MKNRNIFVMILATLLVVSLTCAMSVLNTGAAAWNGSASSSLVGSGTEADPFKIANGADLAYLAQKVNGGDACTGQFFKQMDDIDLGGNEWTPIGKSSTLFFAGVFDGAGFVISNFKVTNQQWSGLFGYMNGSIASGIKNVIVKDADISGTYSGGIISYAIGGSYLGGCVTAENCIVKGTTRVGGIASTLSTGSTISYCINNATVSSQSVSTNSFYGGVTGVLGGGSVMSYCVNNGKVTSEAGSTKTDIYCGFGGITGCSGAVNATGNIDHCYNTGAVEVGSPDLLCSLYVGGITGIAAQADTMLHLMSDCFNFGTVSCTVNSSQVYCGSFAGLIKFFGQNLKNVFALTGTAKDMAGLVNYEPVVDGYAFTDQNTLEKKAASVNKGILGYNPDLSKWLLNLDILNVEETTAAPETSAPETTAAVTSTPVTTTAVPESTVNTPDTTSAVTSAAPVTTAANTEKTGSGCGSSAALPAGSIIIFALATFHSLNKKKTK